MHLMQQRPRIAVLVSLVTAVLLVAGCSSSSKPSGPLPDAATLIKDSAETTRQQTSVHLLLTVTGDIKELPIAKLDGDLTLKPAVAAQGKADIVFMGQKVEDVDFAVVDGTLFGALTPGSFTDFGPAADIYDVSAILSPDLGLANILTNFSDAKAEGRETLNGVDTVKVTGKVTGEAVNGIAPQIGAAGPVPATAWIREDGNHELMQAKLDVSPGNSVQMTLTDWGKTVNVTKPAV
jgi:lipoprotein LprG